MSYSAIAGKIVQRATSRACRRCVRTAAGVAVAAVVAFGALAMHPARATAAATVELAIDKFAFAPKEITVRPGTTIVWTNHDEAPHTVVSSDKSFASKGLDTDDRFEHTFEREGDFGYICSVHPFMTGVVHVLR
ncbi:MAG TPA: cupredoxin family copper-binding protein [Casimicrobiaceae bacterium]|nr:cupredoxin family copper-binding protein [Casimicrobiaceae bacterium]